VAELSLRDRCGAQTGADPEPAGGIIYRSHLAWEHLGISQEELESVAGEKEVWRALLSLLPPRPAPDKRKRMDGLMNNNQNDQASLYGHEQQSKVFRQLDKDMYSQLLPPFI